MGQELKVVVSGMGIHCALGHSYKEFLENLNQGKCGITPIKRFDVSCFEPQLGGMVPCGDSIGSDEERLYHYALTTAREALQSAAIQNNKEVSLILGTSNGIGGRKIKEIGNKIAHELGLGGLVLTVSTACTSSAHAIGFGADILRRGYAGVVLAGGVDILTQDVFAGFHCLGLLSRNPCSPFSNTLGTTLGEGGAFLVLEPDKTATERKVKPHAVFMGYGLAADAFHDTSPDPAGSGICKAIAYALVNSNLNPSEIDYINAHGTGTAANDSAEWRGIQNALSPHGAQLPVSSSKSFFGHGQGAAAAMEAIATIACMNQNTIPPTLNYAKPRPFSPADPVAQPRPRPHHTRFVLSTNAAFGGLNTAMIFGKNDVNGNLPQRIQKPVSVHAYAINTDEEHISNFIPYEDIRNLDLSATLLAGVVAKVLTEAGIQIRSNECENIGLFVGQDSISEDSLQALAASIQQRGIKHLSAAAFTRLVVNYPAGACCRLFGIKGPVAVVAARPDNGLAALCLAADHLAWRDDTDLMIVASVDDQHKGSTKPPRAVAMLLRSGDDKQSLCLEKWTMQRNFDPNTSDIPKVSLEDTLAKNTANESEPDLYDLVSALTMPENKSKNRFQLKTKQSIDQMEFEIVIERKNHNAN
jgi:3-oxoacyl-[acyl-carrier-protein] synthase II